MLAVKVNGKWGFIDRQGKLLIAPKFDSVDDFFQGKAEVEIGGKKIFISKWGNILKGCQSN